MRSADTNRDGEDDLDARFNTVIATLAEGGLTFPAPYDLATSAALAVNVDVGAIALALFQVTAARDTGYRVEIYETAPGVPEREVVNTTVDGTRLLIALLDGLAEEQSERLQR